MKLVHWRLMGGLLMRGINDCGRPQRDGIKNRAAATGLLSCILIVERYNTVVWTEFSFFRKKHCAAWVAAIDNTR